MILRIKKFRGIHEVPQKPQISWINFLWTGFNKRWSGITYLAPVIDATTLSVWNCPICQIGSYTALANALRDLKHHSWVTLWSYLVLGTWGEKKQIIYLLVYWKCTMRTCVGQYRCPRRFKHTVGIVIVHCCSHWICHSNPYLWVLFLQVLQVLMLVRGGQEKKTTCSPPMSKSYC